MVSASRRNAYASEIVKNTPGVKIPIGVVGAVYTPEVAEEILAKGQADYILMARSAMADPEGYAAADNCNPFYPFCWRTTATRDMIDELDPDAVIVAVGAEQIVPKIPGVEKATMSFDQWRS